MINVIFGLFSARATFQPRHVMPHIQAGGFQVSGQLLDEGEVPARVGDEDLDHG